LLDLPQLTVVNDGRMTSIAVAGGATEDEEGPYRDGDG
jgi:hypothetical protein